ncbi:MAG: glycosyltransferase [Ruminococcaceae bacterium]|nr:glycosyltransferase [Oscillospiraceae bacterium]
MKKRLLVIGISMNCAGTEKSFLSFANTLNKDEYSVDLLLAKKEGLFMELIPSWINVIEMEKYGEMFLLSGSNAVKTMFDCFIKKDPLTVFELLPYFLKIVFDKKNRSSHATRMWIHFMHKMSAPEEEYDAAIAYWGDRTMFYMCDKVKAKKKIAWLHFDYSFPPRDDSIYLPYFEKCDTVVTVSEKVDKALKDKLPSLEKNCVMMENINDAELINSLAETADSYKDTDFNGKRVLSIGRIIEQKGFDFIPPVLKRLKDEGHDLRWYILGSGDEENVRALKTSCKELGVSDMLCFLGTTVNPYGYLKNCDIYAQPSRYEGKPITVQEALILARPIVISDYLSASEQLEGGRYGIICPIGPEGLYEGMKKMLCEEGLAESFIKELKMHDFGNSHEIEKFYLMLEDKNI